MLTEFWLIAVFAVGLRLWRRVTTVVLLAWLVASAVSLVVLPGAVPSPATAGGALALVFGTWPTWIVAAVGYVFGWWGIGGLLVSAWPTLDPQPASPSLRVRAQVPTDALPEEVPPVIGALTERLRDLPGHNRLSVMVTPTGWRAEGRGPGPCPAWASWVAEAVTAGGGTAADWTAVWIRDPWWRRGRG